MVVGARAALIGAAIVGTSARAAAEPMTVGGWLGPRFFSDDAALGYIVEAPEHPHLENGMVLGFRIAKPLMPWLVPEAELPISITGTSTFDATVFWFEPRAHVRFEFLGRNDPVRPFLLLGGGAPIALSSKRRIFANDIVGDGYFGVGAHVASGRGFHLRGDFRISVGPGVEKRAVLEFEAGIGLWFELGKRAPRLRDDSPDDSGGDPDPDRDGIVGTADGCPERPEDLDQHEDTDGCPDIDNDLDQVLDIADKCATQQESLNGYEDDDGCPDLVPDELEAIDGTIEGVTYEPGETSIRASGRKTLKKIARMLAKYPAVRVKLTGYTDDRESAAAKPAGKGAGKPGGKDAGKDAGTDAGKDTGTDGPPPEGGDGGNPAVELSLERAAVIKAVLIANGVDESRITIEGKGADEPVGDNTGKRGRQANRRVVLQRFVPTS